MTKPHQLAFYMDGYFKVDFCKVCGAEGLLLRADCPEKFIDTSKNTLDEKKQISK